MIVTSGRAVAVALAGTGYSVVLAGRRVAELESTASLISGSRPLVVSADVSDPGSVAVLFERIRAEFGRLESAAHSMLYVPERLILGAVPVRLRTRKVVMPWIPY